MPGELEYLLAAARDPAVVELMLNSDGVVYVERAGAALERLASGVSPELAGAFLKALVGGEDEIGPKRPFADLSAADGSRVHAIGPPLTRGGLCVTVRKRPPRRPSLDELTRSGAMPENCAAFLKFAVGLKRSILVAGGTSSGKTTLLNALAGLADPVQRILVLEDTPELTLAQPHVVYLKTRLRDPQGADDVTLRDLVVNALRMRPDRIIVGECRSVEAADLLQAMNVGNEGVMATLHANGAREALQRLETLVLMSGVDLPLRVARQNIAQALDLVVFMALLPDGTRRVVQVAEITGLEGETITAADLYRMESRKSPQGMSFALRPTGAIPRFYDALRHAGLEAPVEWFKQA